MNSSHSLKQLPGRIVRVWTERYGFLWRKKKTFTVEAIQVASYTTFLQHRALRAQVTIITDDGDCIIPINCLAPLGDYHLALQVHDFATSFTLTDPIRKKILLKFCSKCKGYNSFGYPTYRETLWRRSIFFEE